MLGLADERLAAAFAAARGPALLIGMDTPQVTPGLLTVGWDGLDAWFGPAADGGFRELGLREPDPCHERMRHPACPCPPPGAGAAQPARLSAAGLRVATLPLLRDVAALDAAALAALAPQTRFAARVRDLAPVIGPQPELP